MMNGCWSHKSRMSDVASQLGSTRMDKNMRNRESRFRSTRIGTGTGIETGAAVTKRFEATLAKQIGEVEKAHRQELKNVEAVAVEDAVRFIKKHAEKVTRAMTREHHKVLQQFLDYKDRVDTQVSGLDEARARMSDAELLVA